MKRRNPSKCNDGAFSKTGNKQGACTWHQGVAKEVTTSEYNKSKSRVRHGSPKSYKGAFASRIKKTIVSKEYSYHQKQFRLANESASYRYALAHST